MMNSDDGFVCMCGSNDHSGSVPVALMDCRHHFHEVPRAIRHHHDRAGKILHDHVYSMHACHPLTNVIAKHKTKYTLFITILKHEEKGNFFVEY